MKVSALGHSQAICRQRLGSLKLSYVLPRMQAVVQKELVYKMCGLKDNKWLRLFKGLPQGRTSNHHQPSSKPSNLAGSWPVPSVTPEHPLAHGGHLPSGLQHLRLYALVVRALSAVCCCGQFTSQLLLSSRPPLSIHNTAARHTGSLANALRVSRSASDRNTSGMPVCIDRTLNASLCLARGEPDGIFLADVLHRRRKKAPQLKPTLSRHLLWD